MEFKNYLKEFASLKDNKDKMIAQIKHLDLPVVVFGAGYMAKVVTDWLKEQTIEVFGYAVDDEYFVPNQTCNNKPLYRFSELSLHSDEYIFFLGMTTEYKRSDEFLHNNKIVHYSFSQANSKNIDYDIVTDNIIKFDETYNLLADEISRETFVNYIKSNISGDLSYVQKIFTSQEQYFNDLTIDISSNRLSGGGYVDCGAYDGDTIEKFIEFSGGNYSNIWAFEPDPKNFAKLKDFVQSRGYRDVSLFNGGAWDEKTTLHFDNRSDGGSMIADSGEITIAVDSIDNIVGGDKVSLIKMDIEGSELKALHGAANTIKRDKPILTICVYHKTDDLITIPQYIESLNLNYKFYLRHHNYSSLIELILYAIPQNFDGGKYGI